VKKKRKTAGCQWLTPVILATQEAEIRRISVQSQLRQIVCKTLSQKTLHKNRVSEVAQGEGPEFKPQYHKNQNQTNKKTKKTKEGGGKPERQQNKSKVVSLMGLTPLQDPRSGYWGFCAL
jgi:hypothetical protein